HPAPTLFTYTTLFRSTNFGAFGADLNTTLGTATGDLRGAVSGTLLGVPQPGSGNTVIFRVQHHWVTETGDALFFDPATATTVPIDRKSTRLNSSHLVI